MKNEKTSRADLPRYVKMAALAVTVFFDMLAGPLAGYLLGSWAESHWQAPASVRTIGAGVGLLVSFYLVSITVRRIIMLDQADSGRKKE